MSRFLGLVVLSVSSIFAFSAGAQTATTTTVNASPTSGLYGGSVALAAGVAASTAPVVNGSGGVILPTGTVQFLDGATALSSTPTALGPGPAFNTIPFDTFFGALDPTFKTVTGQLSADLNGDGTQDLLVYQNIESGIGTQGNPVVQASVEIQAFLSTTKGSYAAAAAQTLTLPLPPPSNDFVLYGPVLVDLNGDGKLDLLIGPSVAYGNGDGTFQQPVTLSFLATGYINTFSADLNGDGKADIVAVEIPSNLSSNAVVPLPATVFINQGGGNFQSAGTFTLASGQCACFGLPYASLSFADLNGDGKLDIVAQTLFLQPDVVGNASVPTQMITSLLNNGDGTFASAVPVSYTPQDAQDNVYSQLLTLTIADFKDDGKPDLALVYPTQDLVSGFTDIVVFLPGNGDGTFGNEIDSTLMYPMPQQGPEPAAPGGNAVVTDANLDGKPDLVFGTAAVALGDGKGDFSAGAPISSAAFGTFGVSLGFLQPVAATVPDLVFAAPAAGSVPSPFVAIPNLGSAASLALTTLAAGTHSITASYSGDSHYLESTSAPVTVTIGPVATTTTLAASPNPSYATEIVSFAVTVANPGPVATGTVTLTAGSTTLGSGTLDATGNASVTATFPTAATETITASYGGDANHAASSGTLSVMTVPAFTLQGGGGSTDITVTSGQSASAQLSVTGGAGYTGSLALTCTGLPVDASCTFNPGMLSLSGGATVTSTLTVSTAASTTSMLTPLFGVKVLSCGMFASGLLFLWPRRRRASWLAIALVACALLPMGCGGNKTPANNTPVGTYTFKVVATAGGLQTTTGYTLTVQ